MKVEAKKSGGKVSRWAGNGSTTPAKRSGPEKFSKGMAGPGRNLFRAQLQKGGK
jgi:hypothetical protein